MVDPLLHSRWILPSRWYASVSIDCAHQLTFFQNPSYYRPLVQRYHQGQLVFCLEIYALDAPLAYFFTSEAAVFIVIIWVRNVGCISSTNSGNGVQWSASSLTTTPSWSSLKIPSKVCIQKSISCLGVAVCSFYLLVLIFCKDLS